MTKNTKQYTAYIDEGIIKIIDKNGFDMKDGLNATAADLKRWQVKAYALSSIFCLFVIATLSNPFFLFFHKEQVAIFVAAGMISGFFALECFSFVNKFRESLTVLKSEFNLAKQQLQDEILNLEMVLNTHRNAILEEKLKQKFSFASRFKKVEAEKEL